MMYEGHGRISQALLAIVAAVVGFSSMLVGSFTRFSHWKQILGALVSLIVLKSVDNAFADAARSDVSLWPLSYGATVLGLLMALALLWISDKPGLFRRRSAPQVPA
jgi:lipopolysaccharide export system permease protein